jgi:rhodanese-related sulfurtransferase
MISKTTPLIRTTLIQATMIIGISLVLGFVFNHFRDQGLPLVEDWSMEARMASPEGESLIISLEDARTLHESGTAVFLDARPEAWYEMEHIEGALNIPAEQVETLYSTVLADVARDTPIITYCDGEACELSHDLAIALLERGFTNVRVLINGWTLWLEAALPTEGSGS